MVKLLPEFPKYIVYDRVDNGVSIPLLLDQALQFDGLTVKLSVSAVSKFATLIIDRIVANTTALISTSFW
jgi:hypothetical protein